MTHAHILPFTAVEDPPNAELDTVGGKGQSLASVKAAGFPVPAGFAVTTAAYRQFVKAPAKNRHGGGGESPESAGISRHGGGGANPLRGKA